MRQLNSDGVEGSFLGNQPKLLINFCALPIAGQGLCTSSEERNETGLGNTRVIKIGLTIKALKMLDDVVTGTSSRG